MEYKKKYTKPNKSNYNQFIEEAGIKEEIEKENKKNLSENLKPKKKDWKIIKKCWKKKGKKK